MLQRQQNRTSVEELEACISLEEVEQLQHLASQVKVATELQQYMLSLVRASRQDEEITLGISPRGSVALQRATQALAFLEERDYAIPDDVKYLAPHVLSHRLIPAAGRKAKIIVEKLLRSVPVEKFVT